MLASFPGFPLAFVSPAVEKCEIKAREKPGNEARSMQTLNYTSSGDGWKGAEIVWTWIEYSVLSIEAI